MGSLHTMQYSASLHSPVMIVLNLTLSDYSTKYRFVNIEHAIETAASLCMFFTNLKQEIGFITNGVVNDTNPVYPVRGGYAHSISILEGLARIKENENNIDELTLMNN